MVSLFDDLRNVRMPGFGLGVFILTQGGCGWLVTDELSDTRGGEVLAGVSFGGNGDQNVAGAVIDAQGRIVLTGRTTAGITFSEECNAVGMQPNDIFLASLDTADLESSCQRSKQIGGDGNDVVWGIAHDNRNDAIGIVGRSDRQISIGPVVIPYGENDGDNAMAIKLPDAGDPMAKSFGFGGFQEAHAIAFDSQGAAFIGGTFGNMLDSLASSGGLDAFIVKVNADFAPVSYLPWGDTVGIGDQKVHRLAIDLWDNVIASGYFEDGINFGCMEPLTTGSAGTFVVSLGSDNQCKWRKKITEGAAVDVGDMGPLALTVDRDGNIFVAGSSRSMTVFPDEGNDCRLDQKSGNEDAFVAKLDKDGTCLWSRRFQELDPSAPSMQRAHAIAVDSESNVYVTGEFDKSIHFAGNHTLPLTSDDVDSYVVKWNADGDYLWSRAISGSVMANAIAMDPEDEFFVIAGSFQGTLNFGNTKLESGPGSDVFVLKLSR